MGGRSAKIHRTVRCASGATVICAQRSTLQSVQLNSECHSRSQRGTGLSGAAPDCPVPHEDKASNGRPAPRPNGRMTWRRTEQCPVAHRTVRCTRVNQLKLLSFGFPRRRSAIIHRTVRCTSGATAICAQRSTLQSEQCNSDVRADGQRGTGLSGVASDCPVPHEDKASNGQPAPSPNDKMMWRRTGHCPVAHQTVRCAHRQ